MTCSKGKGINISHKTCFPILISLEIKCLNQITLPSPLGPKAKGLSTQHIPYIV